MSRLGSSSKLGASTVIFLIQFFQVRSATIHGLKQGAGAIPLAMHVSSREKMSMRVDVRKV